MGERVLGVPGDIATSLSGWGTRPVGRKGLEQESLKRKINEKIPTSQNLQEYSEALTGGYTTPRTSTEARTDEIMGGCSFIHPSRRQPKRCI